MHWLDRMTAAVTARQATMKRAFSGGWGDEDTIRHYLDGVHEVHEVDSIDLARRPARRSGRVVVSDLQFESPETRLPWTGRVARARWLTTSPEPERLVVIHPAWNDEGYTRRRNLALLLLDHGIASVLPEHPFYGSRRSVPVEYAPITTVSDFCLMGRAAVLEGRALVTELDRRGYRVGVAGYSMGGNIAGFVAATAGVDLPATPIAASYSAGPVFSDGLLRRSIDWNALGGASAVTADRLFGILGAASILDFEPPRLASASVVVAGTKDGYVPNATSLALHRHWAGSKMDWVNAGHASLLWRNLDRMAAAIRESFDRRDQLVDAERG